MKPMTESSALFSRTFLVASACVKWALRLLVLGCRAGAHANPSMDE
jgi:hypothetical protein